MNLDLEARRRVTQQKFIEFGLPHYMWGGMDRYIYDGIAPGGFMASVLCNDLRGAVGRADDNIRCLPEYVKFLYNYAPAGCWGGDDQYHDWIDRGGLNGINN